MLPEDSIDKLLIGSGKPRSEAEKRRPRYDPNVPCVSDLALLAGEILEGKLPPGYSEDERYAVVDGWLRWSQKDEAEVRTRWWFLARRNGLDRDTFVLSLWQTIVGEHKNSVTRQEIDKQVPFDFYQWHFFRWFLGRFDVPAARAVFVSWPLARWLHEILALVTVTSAFAALQAPVQSGSAFWMFLAWLFLLGGIGSFAASAGLPLSAWFNSLIPRLAAAVGIGYLFLFSAPHLVQIINASRESVRSTWGIVVVLTVTAFFYIMFHIYRRVYPPLRKSILVWRSLSILALAVSYSALELLIAAPILFSSSFLCGVNPASGCYIRPDLHRLALCAAIALNLGVVLQLAWDEKPLTEPL